MFTVFMCGGCQAARGSSVQRYPPTTSAEMPASDDHEPAELLAYRDIGAPWLEYGCPIEGCGYWVVLPWWLEEHAAAEHAGWVATWESDGERVVYRRVGVHGSGG
jgi:hypothetical protein